ncbi:ATP-dependent zinc metalloprotease FtsH [Dermatobacter hominis]|uniref:ATP-dependent zinc metalloprotease FtsH n=1 Tax=Dermatobacter hominis TaxID=2884263 RepID=UPI001D11558D|nr:ATP-dependent zinc metalloprotease FtsH [Dermatobacter hominis]UDY34444.1 ATP-dependent zinc metalloprotease FtsH [Dermatobacter hominis]
MTAPEPPSSAPPPEPGPAAGPTPPSPPGRRAGSSRRWPGTTTTRIAAVVVVVAAVGALVWGFVSRPEPPEELRLDQFQDRLADDEVRTATIVNSSSTVEGELTDGTRYRTVFPEAYGERLTQELLDRDVEAEADNSDGSIWSDIVFGLLPTFLIVGVFVWFVLQMQRGGRAMKFGRARTSEGDRAGAVTFADVAGADEAVTELREVVEFLRDPERFLRLGARIPKGVLLVGPPGTGKTLLARAVAGEAGVPFLSLSGSDFVEMFVGVGASRVRDLFRQAAAQAPAIVFVDEIDAVGRHRGAGVGGGHDEREQTLNQLLVEMDGFAQTDGVVLIAATNRPDILDPALLRPGRFDRQVVVDAPDVAGRTAVLEVHLRGKPTADDLDVAVLARRTPGFSGADLANLVNEGALLAARRGSDRVTASDLAAAVDRVLAGPERSRILSPEERRVVAVHESGHAIVSHLLPHADDVHKVSIVARGAALGYTVLLPEQDRHLHSRAQLSDQLAVALAGRAAEEAVFGELTTGAADDIDRATRLARAMVTEYGMSDKLGPRRFVARDGEPFLGLDAGRSADHGDEVAARVDEEVSRLLDEAHERARRILEAHRPGLDLLAATLLEQETVADDELVAILAAVGAP